MSVPITASEVSAYTPESLKKILGEDAPSFRLRAPNERHTRRFRQVINDEGLVSHSEDDFTAEKRKAIAALWTEEDAAGILSRLETLLESVRQKIEVSAEDLQWLDALDDKLFENWQPLRVMRRQNGEMQEYAPRIALATYVTGWTNFDVPVRLDAGYLSDACLKAAEKELRRLAAEHLGAENRNVPFLELYIAAARQLTLTEDEEKNSPAPSQPGSNPDASTASNQTDGASSEENTVAKTDSTSSTPTTAPEAE